jgi:hypothetical protein
MWASFGQNHFMGVYMMRVRRPNRFFEIVGIVGLLLALALILAPQGQTAAQAGALPPNSNAFGKTLAQWQALWLSWAVGDTAIDPDANGNADVGNVVLLPIPGADGSGTPASVDVTLHTGQAFTLPLWLNFGNSYSDGTPNDPLVPLSVFQTMDFKLVIDGVTVIDKRNLMSYYTESTFAPGIAFDFPPAATIISLQSIGLTHTPLPPGKHTMTLHAANTQALPPQYGGGFLEFNNTWNIIVKPGGK